MFKIRRIIPSLFIILIASVLWFSGETPLYYEENSIVSGSLLEENLLIPGGTPVGIYMDTNGVMVIETTEITDDKGNCCHPGDGLVESGDYITKLNGITIETKDQLVKAVENLTGEPIYLELRREEELIEVSLTPTKDTSGAYKLGLWVRDNLQGLGTLTYVDLNNKFGALGHGIHDMDTSALLEITSGELYRAGISGVIPGVSGKPGGLEGVIIYTNYNNIGTININSDAGIYGTIDQLDKLNIEEVAIPAANVDEMKKGPAIIKCTIDDEVVEYDIEILKVNKNEKEVNKGLVIEITDPDLLAITGGIVQGMSGSPIIQNGKIIGAVTHVMVNDPTRGYGIFIGNMLEMSEGINN